MPDSSQSLTPVLRLYSRQQNQVPDSPGPGTMVPMESSSEMPSRERQLAAYRERCKDRFTELVSHGLESLDGKMEEIFRIMKLDQLGEGDDGLRPADVDAELERSIEHIRFLHVQSETSFAEVAAMIKPGLQHGENTGLLGSLLWWKGRIEAYLTRSEEGDKEILQRFATIRNALLPIRGPLEDPRTTKAFRALYEGGKQLKMRRQQDASKLLEETVKAFKEVAPQEIDGLQERQPDGVVAVEDLEELWDKKICTPFLDFVQEETRQQEDFMAGVMDRKRRYEEAQKKAVEGTLAKYKEILANLEFGKAFYGDLVTIVNYSMEQVRKT